MSDMHYSGDRDLALRVLYEVDSGRGRPEDSPQWGDASALSRELVLSTLRHRRCLQALTDHLAERAPKPRFRPLIEIGLVQLFLLDGIPDHAALHETLEAGKRAGIKQGVIGFINALLRRALREKSSLEAWMQQQPLAIRCSHPDWLVAGWEKAFGTEKAITICEWNQQRSCTFVRQTSEAALFPPPDPDLLEPVEGFPGFFRLTRGISPVCLDGFEEGAWYVQDPSTTIAPGLLAPKTGEQILDACAAPGGKTALLAEAVGEKGKGIVATDRKASRVKRLQENMDRLGYSAVDVVVREMGSSHSEPFGPFEGILLDVPCSNTGVLQRRPDVKEHLKPHHIETLCALQRTILEDASRSVSRGGRIVYSTCSIEPAETTQLIATWLQDHPEWQKAKETLLLPGDRNCDGCYAVLLQHLVR